MVTPPRIVPPDRVQVHIFDPDGFTLLHHGTRAKEVDVVLTLLQFKLHPDAVDASLLAEGMGWQGMYHMVAWYEEACFTAGKTPIEMLVAGDECTAAAAIRKAINKVRYPAPLHASPCWAVSPPLPPPPSTAGRLRHGLT